MPEEAYLKRWGFNLFTTSSTQHGNVVYSLWGELLWERTAGVKTLRQLVTKVGQAFAIATILQVDICFALKSKLLSVELRVY